MSTAKNNDPADDSIRYITTIDYIAARWWMLPPHIRETIVMLVDVGTPKAEARGHRDERLPGGVR